MDSQLFDSPLFRDLSPQTPPRVNSARARRRRASTRQAGVATATLATLDQRFQDYCDREGTTLSTRTLAHYTQTYRMFRRYLIDGVTGSPDALSQRLGDLDAYVAWLRARGIAPITVNTYWRGLRSFFRFLEKHHGVENPYRTQKAPRFQTPPPKALAVGDCRRILLTAANYPQWNAFQRARAVALVGVMLYAGLRRGEALRLVNNDVSLTDGTIRILHGKGPHGGKTRFAEINAELETILRVYLRERNRIRAVAPEFFVAMHGRGGLTESAVTQIVRKLARASDVPFSSHRLRHSFVTQLLRAGVPIHIVRDLAGHANISTTLGYTRVFSEDRRRGIRRLSFR